MAATNAVQSATRRCLWLDITSLQIYPPTHYNAGISSLRYAVVLVHLPTTLNRYLQEK